MKYCTVIAIALCIVLMLCIAIEARGGRGRGGGSFGGLFGGWRKYKKHSSSGNGRRVLSGSPMHTALTSSSSLGSSVSVSSSKSASTLHSQSMVNYPKQHMPAGYASIGGHHYSHPPPPPGYGFMPNGHGYQAMPPRGTFYPNAGTLPTGALYYPQTPPMHSDSGNFFTGILTGHMMNNLLFGHRHHHVTHIYQQPNENTNSKPEVIIINNGQEATMPNNLGRVPLNGSTTSPSSEESPLNATSTLTSESNKSDNKTISKIIYETFYPTASTTIEIEPTTVSANPVSPPGNIVCFPIMLNETDPNNTETVREVEKIVCFPAPSEMLVEDCMTRTYNETDPADPTKTIQVQRQECAPAPPSTTTTTPRIIGGEIKELDEINYDSDNDNISIDYKKHSLPAHWMID